MKPSKQVRFSVEAALYSLAFILALGLRLLNLGAAPLSDYEASFALKAYDLSQGQVGDLGPQPAYAVLTGILFAVFKHTAGTARLFPALAGSSLVFLPLLFGTLTRSSGKLRFAGLILAFGLAFDPGLVAVSRLAGSPVLALAALVMAAGFAWRGNAVGTGVMGGLALLSGPDLVNGLIGLGIAWGAGRLLIPDGLSEEENLPRPASVIRTKGFWYRTSLAAGSVLLVLGMLWLRLPQGLAGLANLIPAYLAGWTQTSGIPSIRLLGALLLYHLLLVVFGLVGVGWSWFRRSSVHSPALQLARLTGLWALAALIPGLLYPSRQVFDVVWALIPLWMLAALLLSQVLPQNLESHLRLPALGMAGVFSLFLVLISYNLLRLNKLSAQPVLYIAIIGGLVLMTLIIIVLVSLGWHARVSVAGAAWGFTVVASVYMFAATWSVSQVRANQPEELWTVGPGPGQTAELLATIEDFSKWKTGLRQSIDITVTVDSPSLRWALRNFSHVTYARSLSYNQVPAVILTEFGQDELRLSTSYRGQELVWRRLPVIQGAVPPNLIHWLSYRELTVTPQSIIIWVRADLFPGYTSPAPGVGAGTLP